MTVKPHLLSALFVAGLASSTQVARATTLSYCTFTAESSSSLKLNGSATQTGAFLELTPDDMGKAGSAYVTTPIPWTTTTSFSTSFRFELEPNGALGADGISFIIQNTAVTALGGTGGGLGYGGSDGGANADGIKKSVEVEFDTFLNTPWDPNANHVAVMENGDDKTHHAAVTPNFVMAGSGIVFAWIDYDATTTALDVYLSQSATKPPTPLTSFDINIASTVGTSAFVGFTGGTGGDTNQQEILLWQLSTSGEPCACGGATACGASKPICDSVSKACRACSGAADCGGTTPVCAPLGDPKAGQCVACVTNGDCDSNPNTATPVCSKTGPTTHTCQACSANAACATAFPAQPLCDKSGPFAGQCVSCITNTDCAASLAGPECRNAGATNACGCASDADCSGATPVCAAGTCRACASDGECAAPTPACQLAGPLAGQCTQCSAANVGQCSGITGACDVPTGTCVGCESNADCAGGSPICNVAQHTCGPCQNVSDCRTFSGLPVCATSGMRQGQCVGCLTASDCTAPTAICDPATNTCVGCTNGADCGGATPTCSSTTSMCVPCMTDADCALPTPACQETGPSAGTCGQCSGGNASQCKAGSPTPVCETATGSCGCGVTSDCAPGQVCEPGQPPAGQCVSAPPLDGGTGEGGAADGGLSSDSGLEAGALGDGSPGGGDAAPPVGDGGSGGLDGAAVSPATTGEIAGGGCSCSVPGDGAGTTGAALASLLAIGAFQLLRLRRRREAALVKRS